MDKYTYEDSNFIGENHPDIPSSNESLFYNRRFLMLHIAISQICVNWIFFIFLHELAKRANTFKPSAKTIWKQAFVLLAWTWTLL